MMSPFTAHYTTGGLQKLLRRVEFSGKVELSGVFWSFIASLKIVCQRPPVAAKSAHVCRRYAVRKIAGRRHCMLPLSEIQW
jgi:hypothetical protein